MHVKVYDQLSDSLKPDTISASVVPACNACMSLEYDVLHAHEQSIAIPSPFETWCLVNGS